jgi:hypothetical protein
MDLTEIHPLETRYYAYAMLRPLSREGGGYEVSISIQKGLPYRGPVQADWVMTHNAIRLKALPEDLDLLAGQLAQVHGGPVPYYVGSIENLTRVVPQ